MEIILALTTTLAILVALFYRSKAKEFESLFELSKGYNNEHHNIFQTVHYIPNWSPDADRKARGVIKLNKDGSIAKKRGRKSNVKTT